MVNSISGMGSTQYMPQASSKLTDDQKSQLEEIISNYDPENMTQEDMKSMMDEIRDAGITPSKDLRDIMDAAGFKPPEKPQGPPPDDSTSETKQQLPDYLLDFIQKQESGSVTQDDINSLIKDLTSSGLSSQGSIVDQKV
jgi:hypothetical protein